MQMWLSVQEDICIGIVPTEVLEIECAYNEINYETDL